MRTKIRNNPLHFFTGIGIFGIGLRLMVDDTYFFWPPMLKDLANDDVFGFIFVAIGLSMLVWLIDGHEDIKWNRYNLTLAAVAMAFLTVYQFLHFVATGHDTMPWISNGVILAYIIILAGRSDSGA